MEYYAAGKKKEFLLCDSMDGIIMLSELSQSEKDQYHRISNRVFPWESGLENASRLLWLALPKTPSPGSETVDVHCLSSR